MPNHIDYRKSISDELISIKDRVRNFIDDRHWGEDGRYKEIILIEKLKELLPESVSIGTGFVMCDDNETTTQIDIIIYNSSYPALFKKESFVIVPKESVLGIIEVKTKLNSGNIAETICKSNENGRKISPLIFNGIFSYESDFGFNGNLPNSISTALNEHYGYLNNIAFGKNVFMKYWDAEQPFQQYLNKHFSFYRIDNLAFGYFISNIIEDVHRMLHGSALPPTLASSIYPIENTKEVHKIGLCEINLL